MGEDKALVEVAGRPLAVIAADALRTAGATEVLAVGGGPRALSRLAGYGLRPRGDDHPGEGPLAGLVTALAAAREDVVVVLPCDVPGASPAAVNAVLDALADADAAVPLVDGRSQPLHAAYHRRALPALRGAFAAGVRAPRLALDALDVRVAHLEDATSLEDVDTPAELAAARRRLGSRGTTGGMMAGMEER